MLYQWTKYTREPFPPQIGLITHSTALQSSVVVSLTLLLAQVASTNIVRHEATTLQHATDETTYAVKSFTIKSSLVTNWTLWFITVHELITCVPPLFPSSLRHGRHRLYEKNAHSLTQKSQPILPVLFCTKSSIFEHIRHQMAYQVFLHTFTRFVHDVTTPTMDCVTGLQHTMYITIIYSPTLQKHSGYTVSSLTTYTTDIYKQCHLTTCTTDILKFNWHQHRRHIQSVISPLALQTLYNLIDNQHRRQI